MKAFESFTSRMVVMPIADVDTDQIIPARFLKVTDKAGLGARLFNDWRYRADGSERTDFVLNQPANQGRRILLAGVNFGCGSSREHAPWALLDWGFDAVIAPSFADIFRGNALGNGLLPIEVDDATHAQLLAKPEAEVTVDLVAQTVFTEGMSASFPVDAFAKKCLLEGKDRLGYLLGLSDEISAYEDRKRA